MPRIVLATLLCVVLGAPLVVSAGDDVDYSAPYLVVEDGELVTKYPAQEHDGAAAEADVPAGETIESQPATVATEKNWRIAGAVIIVVVAALVMIWRRRQRIEKSD